MKVKFSREKFALTFETAFFCSFTVFPLHSLSFLMKKDKNAELLDLNRCQALEDQVKLRGESLLEANKSLISLKSALALKIRG